MIRADIEQATREAAFLSVYQRRWPFEVTAAGAMAYGWGYQREAVEHAIRAGCADPYEIANWIDVNEPEGGRHGTADESTHGGQ